MLTRLQIHPLKWTVYYYLCLIFIFSVYHLVCTCFYLRFYAKATFTGFVRALGNQYQNTKFTSQMHRLRCAVYYSFCVQYLFFLLAKRDLRNQYENTKFACKFNPLSGPFIIHYVLNIRFLCLSSCLLFLLFNALCKGKIYWLYEKSV